MDVKASHGRKRVNPFEELVVTGAGISGGGGRDGVTGVEEGGWGASFSE